MSTSPASTGAPEAASPRALMARRDGPAALHFAFQTVLFAGSAALTVALAGRGDPAWVVAVCAVALLAFFPSLHESGHQTAFATPALNEATAFVSAFLMLQAPSFFRSFHWEHHRETQDPERDPEISGAPDLVDDWPRHWATYAFVTSGQALMVGKAGFTLACALLPSAVWRRLFPFVRDREARRVAWESRAVALGWAVVLGVGLTRIDGFAALLWAWPLAHLLLGFYLMPEHTGLPHEGTQLERTRTVISNGLVRWWMWNMPYHAEHHAHPGVPYHAVPMLHERMRDQLVHVSPGYAAFHREALQRCLGGPATETDDRPRDDFPNPTSR
jgi:fatty acid desaturase